MKNLLKGAVAPLAFTLVASAWGGELFNGIIVDGKGKGIKGVKVWGKDSGAYTKTDGKGRFGLNEIAPGDTIHISRKKQTYNIPVDTVNGMRIILVEDGVTYNTDDELVSHGYGWVSRRDDTGARSGISGARLKATGQTTILGALRGLVPGLEVSPSGYVTLRGRSSFLSDDQPLFVVDGTIVGSLDMIDINSVDRVEVLKDGSIYGSRGAGGAILVFTKRGIEK